MRRTPARFNVGATRSGCFGASRFVRVSLGLLVVGMLRLLGYVAVVAAILEDSLRCGIVTRSYLNRSDRIVRHLIGLC